MPTPVALIVVGLLLAVVVVAIIRMYLEHRSRERARAAARLAAQATPVTFTVGVNVQLKGVGFHGARVEPAYLTIRGDVIEISSPFSLWRRRAPRHPANRPGIVADQVSEVPDRGRYWRGRPHQ